MDPLVEIEAKLHITNGIEKASGATGVDIKVSVLESIDISIATSIYIKL